MPGVNQEYVFIWDLANASGGPYTGLSGNMTATLNRTADGTSITAAAESVAIAEIGSTSFYTFTYTPLFTQTYILHVAESSLYLETTDQIEVSGAITASADNAYCSESDVIGFVQMGDYTATTKPTENQVITFMENRAGALYGIMSQRLGTSTPGPENGDYSVQLDTTSGDHALALSKVLRWANAAGAAADALQASGAGEAPNRSERVAELEALYSSLAESLMATVEAYFKATVTRAATHISTGQITAPDRTNKTTSALKFDETTRF